MARPLIIFDGDDTLWMTEHLYDNARIAAGTVVAECGLDGAHWDALQREIDVANVSIMGLDRRRFPTSCRQAYERVAELAGRPIDHDVATLVEHTASAVFDRDAPLAEGAVESLELASAFARLALLTKGDDTVQAVRIAASGLGRYFERIVIVTEKTSATFDQLRRELDVDAGECWSVGNSMRSDIQPALDAGMSAIWVDAHVWEYERATEMVDHDRLFVCSTLVEAVEVITGA